MRGECRLTFSYNAKFGPRTDSTRFRFTYIHTYIRTYIIIYTHIIMYLHLCRHYFFGVFAEGLRADHCTCVGDILRFFAKFS